MRSNSGFGIVEVLIGIAVLAIGVVVVAQLQAAGLRFSSKAESLQNATVVAQAELDFRLRYVFSPAAGQSCLSAIPQAFDCQVEVTPCEVLLGTFNCAAGVTPDAYEIVVSATGPRGDSATLTSLVRATSSAGSGGG